MKSVPLLPCEDTKSSAISNLRFSKKTNLLLISNATGFVYLFDGDSTNNRGIFDVGTGVDDCVLGKDDTLGFCGCQDGSVKKLEFENHKIDIVGMHGASVSCVEYSDTGQIFTGSKDRTVKCWDPRSYRVGTHDIYSNVRSMSLFDNNLVVATEERLVNIYDIRDMSQPIRKRRDYKAECVRCSPNGEGYALSTENGRVAWQVFNDSGAGKAKEYLFKAHKKLKDGVESLCNVKSIAFHPIYYTFATGADNGFVYLWDGKGRKKLTAVHCPSRIAALSLSASGLLAVAKSDESTTVFLHQMCECFPRLPPPHISATEEPLDRTQVPQAITAPKVPQPERPIRPFVYYPRHTKSVLCVSFNGVFRLLYGSRNHRDTELNAMHLGGTSIHNHFMYNSTFVHNLPLSNMNIPFEEQIHPEIVKELRSIQPCLGSATHIMGLRDEYVKHGEPWGKSPSEYGKMICSLYPEYNVGEKMEKHKIGKRGEWYPMSCRDISDMLCAAMGGKRPILQLVEHEGYIYLYQLFFCFDEVGVHIPPEQECLYAGRVSDDTMVWIYR